MVQEASSASPEYHAFLYNALADYTRYCTLALLLAATIPAFWWAKGQWLWFRCYNLMIPETPAQLGLEPDSDTPPADGFVTCMPWWGKEDKRYPKLRTPVSADPVLVAKGVQSDPQWDVTATPANRAPQTCAGDPKIGHHLRGRWAD